MAEGVGGAASDKVDDAETNRHFMFLRNNVFPLQ